MSAPLTLLDLDQLPVAQLRGVGPKKEKSLAAVEIASVLDLLLHYPRRYIDRTRQERIVDLVAGDEAMIMVEVRSVQARRTRNRRTMVTVKVGDDSGTLDLTFFNQPWRERQLDEGARVVVFGKMDLYRGRPQMTNPVVDLVGNRTGRIIPVYPQSEKAGLTTWDVAEWVAEALRRSAGRGIADPVPAAILRDEGLIDRHRALAAIHQPESMADVTIARKRLVFDELLRIQLALVMRKRRLESELIGLRHDDPSVGPFLASFHASLPFSLTEAQRRVIAEIHDDLAGLAPMHRLLQGDVGSGKTLVAVSALLIGIAGGHQGALMAPTEVLAEQHASAVRPMLEQFEVPDPTTLLGVRQMRVELLTNRVGAAERRRILAALADGTCDLVIGTHALIQEAVEFASLGVVVVDEQHRFGVEQRAALRDKGAGAAVPDVLVMTATPIPRTAAMTVYGDLDVSVLDELPPGRTPIRTSWVRPGSEDEQAMWEDVRGAVTSGQQVYVVCPLIGESEKLEVASAEETFDLLAAGELAGLRLGLLHGRGPAADREERMTAFRSGELDVLVATTVIEVGVDVPRATVMVVLDADRFGIAQLHQLRGRVGRGTDASRCYLVGDGATADAEARLAAMVRTTDGFELAEVDLDLRGEGTIMGERQKGRNDLRLASLRRDRSIVERAREVAFALVDAEPDLGAAPQLREEVAFFLEPDDAEFLLKS
jgi:ATP-dependent DNA helicase RecG